MMMLKTESGRSAPSIARGTTASADKESFSTSSSASAASCAGYGQKVGEVSRGRFEVRIRELIAGHVTLETVIGAMLAAKLRPG
jgi:hypothetical protein